MERPLYKQITNTICAIENCKVPQNQEWLTKHKQALDAMARHLPSGSGIDCGTKILLEESTSEKIVLLVEFHHMNDCGMYDGWTSHKIKVKPSIQFDFDLTISGKDRNQIKNYLADCYNQALSEIVDIQQFYAQAA